MTIDTRKLKVNIRTTYKVIGSDIEIELKFLSINFLTIRVKKDLFIKFFKDMENIYKYIGETQHGRADKVNNDKK